MTKTSLAVLILLALAAPAHAQPAATPMATFNTDNDGALSLDEAKAAASAKFDAIDTDRGSFRVAVGHRIGRAKHFRIVSERFRNPRDTHHTKTSIVAGLVNLEAGFVPR